MALLDAYATLAQYNAHTGDTALAGDTTLTAQLLGVSRLVERALSLMPGAFNTHTGTYTFDGNGKAILPLRDRAGNAYPFTAITADSLTIDEDGDGSYDDYTLDLADAWMRGLPENAASFGEPFFEIEIRAISTATLTVFPNTRGSVRIAGTFGWTAVPTMITELVCHRTQELRQALKEGGAGEFPAFEAGGVSMRPHTAWLWREVEGLYGRRIPIFR